MNEDIFLVFALGFFLFATWLCVTTQRGDRTYYDRREDADYARQLSERREFGYATVKTSSNTKDQVIKK